MTSTNQRVTAQRITITHDQLQHTLHVTTTHGELLEIELNDGQLSALLAGAQPLYGMTCPNCGGSGKSKVDPNVSCIRCGGSGQS